MLLEEQIASNREKFLNLVSGINNRDGMNLSLLIRQLNESDFFSAPANTRYNGSYEGGLVEHCLNVYVILSKLNNDLHLNLSEDSIRIVSLFHDFSKMNFYDKSVKNEKVYCNGGSKRDNKGTFDWVAKDIYVSREPENRFIFGSREETSAFMINTFIPLSVDEWVAILHNTGQLNSDSAKDSLYDVYRKYPLALYLHIANMIEICNA